MSGLRMLVVVASQTGRTQRMADAVAEGAAERGAEVSVVAAGDASEDALVEADAIVLATGTRARRLPFGQDLEGVVELRTLEDARALRAAMATSPRVVVVGAGFIGMEVAASCRKKGLDVTVVEPLPAPLIRGLGRTLGERVARTHRDEGVEFYRLLNEAGVKARCRQVMGTVHGSEIFAVSCPDVATETAASIAHLALKG